MSALEDLVLLGDASTIELAWFKSLYLAGDCKGVVVMGINATCSRFDV